MADIRIKGIRDVQKLMRDEHESQTKIQIAVSSGQTEYIAREVGDKWTDADGNEWQQQDGYSVKLGKEWQQHLHAGLNTFPNCQKETCTCVFPTVTKLDRKMQFLKGLCFDCVVTMEHKVRLAGKWDEYEAGRLMDNALAWLKEAEADKNIIADELTRLEFHNDFGDTETWSTGNTKDDLLDKINSEFTEFKTTFIKTLEDRLLIKSGETDETKTIEKIETK